MKKIFLICLLPAFIASCSYEVSDSVGPTIKLNLPGDPNSYITLVNYNDVDTIRMSRTGSLTYKLKDSYHPVSTTPVEVMVLMSNTLVISSKNNEEMFELPKFFGPGLFELKIIFAGPSGTGSLSDLFGGENINVVRTWVLITSDDE